MAHGAHNTRARQSAVKTPNNEIVDGSIDRQTTPNDSQKTMGSPTDSLKKRRFNVLSKHSSQHLRRPPRTPNQHNQKLGITQTDTPLQVPTVDAPNIKEEPLLSENNLYTMPADNSDDLLLATCATPLISGHIQLNGPPLHETTKARAERIMLQREAEYISNKVTERSYTRHVNNYIAWWDADQEESGALKTGHGDDESGEHKREGAHPITASKVILFLNYEFERNKKTSSGDGIANTKVGVSSIKQAISGLDWYRRRHHRDPEYQSEEAQRSLRENPDIRRMEEMASAREPKRLEESQEEKAKGVLSKTFTQDDLVRMSIDLLCKVKFKAKSSKLVTSEKPRAASKKTINKALRNRAMLLFTTTMALRGDDTRPILLSDIQVKDVPIVDVGLDNRTKTLIVRSNEGKTNTTGRMDQHPAFRHRNPDLCSISALAFHLFARFHIMYPTIPNFTPKFKEEGEPRAGPYGYRDWYHLVLFPSTESLYVPMSAENHRKQFNEHKDEMHLSHRQVTHVGRSFGASVAMERGATPDSVRALGLWSQPGSFDVYVQSLPTDAMVALAGFNGKQPGAYFIARDVLDPPDTLLLSIFPWIDQEEQALRERVIKDKRAVDTQLTQLFDLLRYCRRVLLQDAAIFYLRHPNAPVFQFSPFNTIVFHEFATSATTIVQRAEDEYRQTLVNLNLPERTIASVRGLMETNLIRQQDYVQELRTDNAFFRQQFAHQEQRLNSFMTVQMQTAPAEKRKRLENVLEDSNEMMPRRPIKVARFLDPSIPAPVEITLVDSSSTSIESDREFVETLPRIAEPHLLSQYPPVTDLTTFPATTTTPPTTQNIVATLPSVLAPLHPPASTNTIAIMPAWPGYGGDGPPIASGSGRLYPWSMFPIHPNSSAELRAEQMRALTSLEQKFGPDKLKRLKHKFDWEGNEWLPDFPGYFMAGVQISPSLESIWQEQFEGIDGRLSIQTLKEIWGTRWRRGNGGIKTEGTRRNKVIKLIESISSQQSWSPEKVFKFLSDKYPLSSKSSYPHLRTSRSFIEFLQKGGKTVEAEIMASAAAYTFL